MCKITSQNFIGDVGGGAVMCKITLPKINTYRLKSWEMTQRRDSVRRILAMVRLRFMHA
jgi:hypothetical protein